MDFQQSAHVVSARIVDREHEIRLISRLVHVRHTSDIIAAICSGFVVSAPATPARTMIVR